MTKEQIHNFVIKNYIRGHNQGVWNIQDVLDSIKEGLDVDFDVLITLYKVINTKLIIPISFYYDTRYNRYLLYYYDKQHGIFDKISADKEILESYYRAVREKKLNILLNKN
jgi:hypothetical protein